MCTLQHRFVQLTGMSKLLCIYINTVDQEGTVIDRQGGVDNAGASEADKLRATEHRIPHLSEYIRAKDSVDSFGECR